MIVLYEVIHSVGSEEEKLYIVAEGDNEPEAEAQAIFHYSGLGLVNANHYKLAENPEFSLSPPTVPQILTNNNDGTWSEG